MNIFPRQLNLLPIALGGAAFIGGGVLTLVVWYYLSPKNLQVGYAPEQPIPYSHRLHVGELGLDCRYCHANVEQSAEAMIPPTQTCMGCHSVVHSDQGAEDAPADAPLRPLWESWRNDESIDWVRVHKLPDHTFFNHSTHLYGATNENGDQVAIGCESCHGRVDQMEIVRIEEPIAMQWCLECHRDPGEHLRPADEITTMGWEPSTEWAAQVEAHVAAVNPPENCSGCHR